MKIGIRQKILYHLKFNRLNLCKTIYLNFKLFPFSQAVKLPVLIYGDFSCNIHKEGKLQIGSPVRRGMVRIGASDPFRSYGEKTFIELIGEISFGEGCIIRRGTRIYVAEDASLNLAENSFISDNTVIACKKEISIGKNTIIGNNCNIMDTDFHYVLNKTTGEIPDNTSPVKIGDNNWISGFCTVKKGARTPEGIILAGPYSMIGKNYIGTVAPNSLMAGCPAKVIRENVEPVNDRNLEKKLSEYYSQDNTTFIVKP